MGFNSGFKGLNVRT